MSEQNVFDFHSLKHIDRLTELVGGLDECKRLGFIFVDEKGIQSISVAGMGYLLFVVARDVTSLAEAFAAGRLAAFDEIKNK